MAGEIAGGGLDSMAAVADAIVCLLPLDSPAPRQTLGRWPEAGNELLYLRRDFRIVNELK